MEERSQVKIAVSPDRLNASRDNQNLDAGKLCQALFMDQLRFLTKVLAMFTFGASQLGLDVKNPPASAQDIRDTGSIPVWGRSPGGGLSSRLQYYRLVNLTDRGDWWATIHRVAQSQT